MKAIGDPSVHFCWFGTQYYVTVHAHQSNSVSTFRERKCFNPAPCPFNNYSWLSSLPPSRVLHSLKRHPIGSIRPWCQTSCFLNTQQRAFLKFKKLRFRKSISFADRRLKIKSANPNWQLNPLWFFSGSSHRCHHKTCLGTTLTSIAWHYH